MAAPDRQQFVQSLLPLAQSWQQRTGIPASVWLAMAASESNWGAAGNSLFGIKGSGSAGSLTSPTWESVNGQRVNTSDQFAAYNSPNDAFQAFWDLVSTSPRYAQAVQHLPDDPQGFLQGINAAGYATDPNWSRSIQNLAATTIAPMLGGQMATTKAPLQEGGTYTPGDQGTTGTGAPLGPQENAYSADAWKRIVASHGGITGVAATHYITKRDLKNNVTRTPDLTAPQTFSFGDGTWVAATITPTGAASIADVGTALKATKPPSAASTHLYGANTKDAQLWDPTTQTWVDNPDYVPPQQNLVPGEQRGGGERDTGIPVDVYNAQTSRQNAETTQASVASSTADRDRQAALDTAKFAWQQAQDSIQNAHNAGTLSLEQAKFAADEAYRRIESQLAMTTQALTQRGQDVTLRGQNLDLATQLGTEASRATTAALPYLAPIGTGAALARAAQQAQAGGTVDARLPTASFPYDPSDLAWQVTQHALASMPQFGQAAATPAPVPVGGPKFGS